MHFNRKKEYGYYQVRICPFCSRVATQKNEQQLEVCHQHLKSIQQDIKCLCGSWLEMRSGKFGSYFHCMNCGNISYAKGIEMKSIHKPSLKKEPKKEQPQPTIITSRDEQYFD